MIAIVDYGMGNIGSILNMLLFLGEEAIITDDPEKIMLSDKLILPGVGSFDQGIINLKQKHLFDVILEYSKVYRKPILGICLGMQLLGISSEEGNLGGLGLIKFVNKRFSFKEDSDLKVPHMGWNNVEINDLYSPLIANLTKSPRYYFVHSYYADEIENSEVLLYCDYGIKFAASVKKRQCIW